MKILFVTPYIPSLIRVRPYQFIRALAHRHEVSVLASSLGGEPHDVAELQALCRRVVIVPFRLAAGVRSCATAVLRGDPLQAAIGQSAELDRQLDALLARERYDVVHIEHLRAAGLHTRVPEDTPAVFDAVDCISLLLERTLHSSHSLRQRLVALLELHRTRAYESRLLARFHGVAVTSAADARALQTLAPAANVRVVPNGVDLDYFRPLAGGHEPDTLVFSGKMSYHANATAVIYFVRHILPLIRRERPGVRLRIVGSRPPRAVQGLARDPAITVTGYVPDIREPLGRSAVAICPITVKVGIQNKLLEAMAMGVPVVSTAAGVEGLAARPGRELLVGDDPAAFAAHVCRLLAEPALRAALGDAGRRFVEAQHRWDSAASQLESLYAAARDRATRTGARVPLGA
jgi:sugar transferase (PEP-CTERM/EpsH1 system associated)